MIRLRCTNCKYTNTNNVLKNKKYTCKNCKICLCLFCVFSRKNKNFKDNIIELNTLIQVGLIQFHWNKRPYRKIHLRNTKFLNNNLLF